MVSKRRILREWSGMARSIIPYICRSFVERVKLVQQIEIFSQWITNGPVKASSSIFTVEAAFLAAYCTSLCCVFW